MDIYGRKILQKMCHKNSQNPQRYNKLLLLTVDNSEQDILHSDINNWCFLHFNMVIRWIYMERKYCKKCATKIARIHRDITHCCCSLPSTVSRYFPKWQVRDALFPFLDTPERTISVFGNILSVPFLFSIISHQPFHRKCHIFSSILPFSQWGKKIMMSYDYI